MVIATWPPFTDEEVGAARAEEPGEVPDSYPGRPAEAHSPESLSKNPPLYQTESEGRHAASLSQCILQLCELDGPGD